jgi:hypothetical protein
MKKAGLFNARTVVGGTSRNLGSTVLEARRIVPSELLRRMLCQSVVEKRPTHRCGVR